MGRDHFICGVQAKALAISAARLILDPKPLPLQLASTVVALVGLWALSALTLGGGPWAGMEPAAGCLAVDISEPFHARCILDSAEHRAISTSLNRPVRALDRVQSWKLSPP